MFLLNGKTSRSEKEYKYRREDPHVGLDTDERKKRELQYDHLRKQYVPTQRGSTSVQSLPKLSQHQYEDDDDILLDSRTNFLPHLLSHEMKDDEYDQYLFRQQQKEAIERAEALRRENSKYNRSFRYLVTSALSWKFQSSKKQITRNEDRSEKINEAMIVYQNKTIDHSKTTVAPVSFNDEEQELLAETDSVLDMYRNLNRSRNISNFTTLAIQQPSILPVVPTRIPSSAVVNTDELETLAEDYSETTGLEEDDEDNKDRIVLPPITTPRRGSLTTPTEHQVAAKTDIRRRFPVVHWYPEKAPKLIYSQPLSEAHCQAIVKNLKGKILLGKYFYNPPVSTILPAGKQQLSVTFIPEDTLRYFSVTEERYIEIEKKKPSLTWDYTGGNIIYLTPLPASVYASIHCELSGGSYEYSHPIGTILELGIHQLHVKYYPDPTHSENYTFGYAKLSIEVSGTIVPLTWALPAGEQFAESNLLKEESAMKQLIRARTYDLKGQPGHPLIYPDTLPEWLFCAKCIYDPATDPNRDQPTEIAKLEPFEVEGEYVYSHQAGQLLPAGYHEITVTFHPFNRQKFHTSTATKVIYIYPNVLTMTWKKPYSIIDGEALDDTILNASISPQVPGQWIYDPPAGTILPRGTHVLTAKYIPTPPANYLPEEMSQEVTIRNKKQLRINWFPPEDIIYLTPLSYEQLNASLFGYGAKSKGTFHYTPDFGTILPVGEHTLSVEFVSENVIFDNVTATVTLRVLPCLSKLHWPIPNAIFEGETIHENVLNCECLNTIGEFQYSIELGSSLPGGEHKLTVTFEPYDSVNFLPNQASVMLLVRKRPKFQAKLYWKHPYEQTVVEYGFALNSTILTARCSNFPGSFSYTPPIDTVLPVGTHELFAYFTPEEPHKCLSGKIISRITIIKRTPLLVWNPTWGYNANTKMYELPYGMKFHSENYLTAYVMMSETDPTRVLGDFLYYTKKGRKFIKRIRFNPIKDKEKKEAKEKREKEKAKATSNNADNKSIASTVTHNTAVTNEQGSATNSKPEAAVKSVKEGKTAKEAEEEDSDNENHQAPLILECGDHVIKVQFIPADSHNFEGAEGEINIFVTRAEPHLSWDISQPLIINSTTTNNNPLAAPTTATQAVSKSTSYDSYNRPIPRYVYPFCLLYVPRPQVTNKSITGKFEYEIVSEHVMTETIEEEVPREEKDDDSSLSSHEGEDRPPLTISRTVTKTVIKKRKITLETVIDAGSHTVAARFYPEDINNYLCHSVEVSFEVIPAVPVIMWEPITTVTFGTVLTKYQHGNAICTNVINPITNGQPGEFVYDPPMGTVVTIALADKYNAIDELITLMKQQEERKSQLLLQQQQQTQQQVLTDKQAPDQTPQQNGLLSVKEGGGGIEFNDSSIAGDSHLLSAITSEKDLKDNHKDKEPGKEKEKNRFGEMKKQHQSSQSRILIESITENYNASQQNTHYLKIILQMTFVPYNQYNYETCSMSKELIIERKCANILWTVPYRLPYGSHLNEKIYCAELSEQDLLNIQAFDALNQKEKLRQQQLLKERKRQLRKQKKLRRQKSKKQLAGITDSKEGPLVKGTDFEDHYDLFDKLENSEEELDEEEAKEEEPKPLYRLEYDPPLHTILSFTQREFMLKVTFIPLENLIYFYNETIKILYVEIYPIAPIIRWRPKCTSLQEGHPLEKKLHCNAVVDRPSLFKGSLVYTPALGSFLSPGHYSICCEYIPNNRDNELPTKIEKHFEVVKKPPKIVLVKDEYSGKMMVKRIYEDKDGNISHSPSPPSSPKYRIRGGRSPSPPASPSPTNIPAAIITTGTDDLTAINNDHKNIAKE